MTDQRLSDDGKEHPSVAELGRRMAVRFALAVASFGGAIGFVPSVIESNTGKPEFWPLVATGVVFACIGGFFLWAGVQAWRTRGALTNLGSAYVIEEIGQGWTPDDKEGFLRELQRHFSSVHFVESPRDRGSRWEWPLGQGAQKWSERVDGLVDSFLGTHPSSNEAHSVFVWAPWPVALAWGQRLVTRKRGLTMSLRQRRSDAREGLLEPKGFNTVAHDFRWARHPAISERMMPAKQIRLELDSDGRKGSSSTQVTVLLVRMTKGAWGPLTLEHDDLTDLTSLPPVLLRDAAGLGLERSVTAELREWRCLADPGPFHAWTDFPALAQAAVTWISAQAACADVVLLGVLAPQEVSTGIGLLLGRNLDLPWPRRLWPIVLEGSSRQLVIADLDLGRKRERDIDAD